ncbi:hypothetical protein [Desulfosporosinus shakirovi]|uniref:hypothetical protein n=1 Tax=Desulfosporosinus shakirovi TaxID=2885154 RepID=UPI001E575565|nr:hypothetical protein [Desulfosporosinus sp. SRJS8]MCB8817359.1 hypothetical protein [Desulfosporosinus sp. SRJS8]
MINQQVVNNWLNKLLNKVFNGNAQEYSILKSGDNYLFCEEPNSRGEIVYRSYLTLHVSDVLNVIRAPSIPKRSLDNGATILYKSQRTFAINEFKTYLINEVNKSNCKSLDLINALENGLNEVQREFKGKILEENMPPIDICESLMPFVWAKELLNNTTETKTFYLFWSGRRFSYCTEYQQQLPLVLEVIPDSKIEKVELVKQVLEKASRSDYAFDNEIKFLNQVIQKALSEIQEKV